MVSGGVITKASVDIQCTGGFPNMSGVKSMNTRGSDQGIYRYQVYWL